MNTGTGGHTTGRERKRGGAKETGRRGGEKRKEKKGYLVSYAYSSLQIN